SDRALLLPVGHVHLARHLRVRHGDERLLALEVRRARTRFEIAAPDHGLVHPQPLLRRGTQGAHGCVSPPERWPRPKKSSAHRQPSGSRRKIVTKRTGASLFVSLSYSVALATWYARLPCSSAAVSTGSIRTRGKFSEYFRKSA